jgi:hypothetical protein
MSDSGTDFIAVDDGTTVRDSGEYDDLVELLEEIVAESKFMKDKHSGPATPQASEPLGGNMTDHWLQPDPNL